MDTREEILKIGDGLIREKGYNAFSFSDIGRELNIRNASIHYHFPSKTSLGVAIIEEHKSKLDLLIKQSQGKDPIVRLNSFLTIYSNAKKNNQICLVGSLVTDYYTVDSEIKEQLKNLTDKILAWVIDILAQGKSNGSFYFAVDTRTKALMVITNMLAAVQLTRITHKQDFELIKQTVINDLTNNT